MEPASLNHEHLDLNQAGCILAPLATLEPFDPLPLLQVEASKTLSSGVRSVSLVEQISEARPISLDKDFEFVPIVLWVSSWLLNVCLM